MSIKGNNSSGLITVPSADITVLNNNTGTRWSVSSVNLHEFGGTGDTVELFKSADASSAAGERIDEIVLLADETKPSLFAPFNLGPGEFLLAKGLAGALVNVEALYIVYTDDS